MLRINRLHLLVVISALLIIAATHKQQLTITIISPTDQAAIAHQPIIEGKVSDPSAEVWVIVHPLETTDYWVQPPITPDDKGNWRGKIYVGRSPTLDVGKRFELMAVAYSKRQLREGEILKGWPEAQGKSPTKTVTRKLIMVINK
jgi:hypothetical protein